MFHFAYDEAGRLHAEGIPLARIADEVIFVANGTAHAPEPAKELMDNPPPELREYLG